MAQTAEQIARSLRVHADENERAARALQMEAAKFVAVARLLDGKP